MNRFRQAAPDPEKASRDGVASYVPSRRQPDLSHRCTACPHIATWAINLSGEKFYACETHRQEYVFSPGVYQERRL